MVAGSSSKACVGLGGKTALTCSACLEQRFLLAEASSNTQLHSTWELSFLKTGIILGLSLMMPPAGLPIWPWWEAQQGKLAKLASLPLFLSRKESGPVGAWLELHSQQTPPPENYSRVQKKATAAGQCVWTGPTLVIACWVLRASNTGEAVIYLPALLTARMFLTEIGSGRVHGSNGSWYWFYFVFHSSECLKIIWCWNAETY